MQRIHHSLILATALALGTALGARADVLTVTTTADGVAGSLRAAIDSAAAGDTIVVSGSLSGGVFALASGELVLDKSLFIVGLGGSNTAINAGGLSRVFRVDSGVDARIRGFTLALGRATGAGDSANGGGIYNAGNLVLDDIKILGGVADSLGGAIHSTGSVSMSRTVLKNGHAQKGGGVYVASGTLGLFDTKVEDNDAAEGAGIWFGGTTATLTAGIVNRNAATGHGGGVYLASGSLTVSRFGFDANSAGGNGGAIHDAGGLAVSRSTFSANTAGGSGGAVHVTAGGSLSAENSTWSGNGAGTTGGALHAGAQVLCRANTFTANAAGTDGGAVFLEPIVALYIVENSILSGNAVDTLADDIANPNRLFSSRYNLYGTLDDPGFSPGTGDLVGLPAELGPLANNGSDTRTHLPGCGSAVLDAADPGLALALDQRNLPRGVNGRSDIGAVEKQDTCIVTPSCAVDAVTIGAQGACDPLTDTYTQELIVSSTSAPATGNLSVNGVLFAVDADTVVLTGLPSDGQPVALTVLYTADSSCAFALDSAWTAPASCLPPPCAVDAVTVGAQGACDPLADTYSQTLIISATSAPATGNLSVNGVLFAVDADTVVLTGLPSDGQPVALTVLYTADSSCAFALDSAWTAPASCLPPPSQTPANIAATFQPTTGNMLLTWDPVPGTFACQVSGRPLGAPNFANVGRSGFELGSITIPASQLNNGVSYEWFVTAACAFPPTPADPTNPSVIDTFTYDDGTGVTCAADSVPTDLASVFVPADSSVILSWDPPIGMINCRVNIRPLGAALFALRSVDGNPPTADTLTADGLVPNTTYEWKVKCSCTVPPGPGESTDFSTLDTFTYLPLRQGRPLELAGGALYPNPARDAVFLETVLPEGAYALALMDVSGRVWHRWEGQSAGEPLRRILALEGVPAGTYLLRATHAEGVWSRRFQVVE
jgi:hypothetical protein